MYAVTSPAPRATRHDISPSAIVVVVGLICAVVSIAVHLPVIDREPVFALLNGAVTCTLATIGTHMILSERQRFTGAAFVVAGVSYPINALDIYPGWGAYVSYVLGGGALFFGSLAWGILRYGRPALEGRAERIFIPVCLMVTNGSGVLATLFARPDWLGFPAGARWVTIWPDELAFAITSVVVCVGFVAVAVYFCVLMSSRLRSTPVVRRGLLQPLAVFGCGLALGAACIWSIATLAPASVRLHTLQNFVGLLTLGVVASLLSSLIRHRLLGAHAIDLLPDVRTPESVNVYLRGLLQDETAELLYWSDESCSLIDGDGLRQTVADELDLARMHTWIRGSDGTLVAMLSCDVHAGGDPTTLNSVRRVVSLVADNARLNALLRMRVAQLVATRTAEQLASMKAREQFRRNLHDGVQQTIASIRLDIDGLYDVAHDAASRSLVDTAMAKLGTALDQVRNLNAGAGPPELQFGLKAAVERCIAELRLQARVDLPEGDLGVLTLPAYYIARECLTNVHKHANAEHVGVRIATDGRMVTVRIEDDGDGGATTRPDGGLAGVQDRVSDLRGTLHIDSIAGAGTTIRVSIPCVS